MDFRVKCGMRLRTSLEPILPSVKAKVLIKSCGRFLIKHNLGFWPVLAGFAVLFMNVFYFLKPFLEAFSLDKIKEEKWLHHVWDEKSTKDLTCSVWVKI